MDLAQTLLDDLYIACQPIMLCSNINVIDGYEILLRSKETSCFPEKTFLWFIADDGQNTKLMDYYYKELRELITLKNDIKLSLNLHPQQLVHPSTWKFLDNLAPLRNNLHIELTEHYCRPDPEKSTPDIPLWIAKLKEKGFSLALDDVGCGQNTFELVASNVQNITTIKLSLLKFRELNEEVLLNFLKSWLSLSNHYHLKMVVEGIESESVSTKLKNLGMVYQQGYYHGKAHVLD